VKRKAFNPLLLLPGMCFWALVGIGLATDDDALIGVAVVLLAAVFIVVIARKVKISSAEKKERQRLWNTGTEATARVIGIGTGGGGMNDHPMVDFELEVIAPGRAPYRVSTSALISKLAIPRIQPGCEIAVRVDPQAPDHLLVDAALTPYGY